MTVRDPGPGRCVRVGVAALLLTASACTASDPSLRPAADTGSAAGSGADAAAPAAGPPVAYVGGAPLRTTDLWPALVEAAGGRVLADAVLDARVRDRLAEAGLTLTEADLDAERDRLSRTLADDADTAVRTLQQLRERRGLGPVRYANLIARNAGLRKLAAPRVNVDEAAVQAAFDRTYGPAAVVRLITVDRLTEAAALRRGFAETGGDGIDFGRLAAERSTDASAAAGGLLPPIRAGDPTWPAAFRSAALRLEPGALSEPLAIGGGFALLRGERRLPAANIRLDDVRSQLRTEEQGRREREGMQAVARELLSAAEVTVLDPALREGWERARAGLRPR